MERFVQPFASLLSRPEQRQYASDFIAGLISDVDRKNAESIAYRDDQDRKPLQHFIGQANWDHQPLIGELARRVGQQLGTPDGVIVFAPSGSSKKGTESVGVKRQWCGRLGKVENSQVGVYKDGAAYEVEFVDGGATVALITVGAGSIRRILPGELLHARRTA